jgi:alcohol dehydrogenase class IV
VTGFEFATAGRIIFGSGTFSQLARIAGAYGRHPLVVTGRRPVDGIAGTPFQVAGEPTIAVVRTGVDAFRQAECDMVIAIGGGSAIDAGKAIAASAANAGDLLDYVEVIGKGQPLEVTPYPFIAIPTTAGTGSEVTRNAVLGSPEHAVKVSLRSPMMLPRAAIVDPDLTAGLPPAITASTGLDALTQLIEPYVSARANPITDGFCRDGIRQVATSLARAYTNGDDREARTGMAYASLLGGLALANAGLGVVHGFAAPIGGMFDAPHGAICAALLAEGMRANIRALRERAPGGGSLDRYREIASIVTGDREASAEDGAAWVEALVRRLSVPGIATWGIRDCDVPELVAKAERASSMKANPIVLTTSELTAVLEHSL